jgi:DNA-binding CsgD family transcriptional regulator
MIMRGSDDRKRHTGIRGDSVKGKRPDKTHLIAKALNRLTDYLLTVNRANSDAPVDGSPDKTPPANSPQGGLSPEFIEKYKLTRREAEVTEVMLRGKSDREIATLLEIALNTVHAHLKHIYKKTGVRGRFALMALAGLGK